MIVHRWLAPTPLTEIQARHWLEMEKADISRETWHSQHAPHEHRHFWTEMLVVLEGELIVNVAGNQVLLRPGDRMDIPSNTRHSYKVNSNACVVLIGQKV
jgi:mannose-6-phosphate isomerase-like protein (cupin superfamily)